MSNYRKNDTQVDPFDTSPESADQAIFGGQPASDLDTGRVVAPPTAIDEIWADVKQPRRAIPASIRTNWSGDPEEVPGLLGNWYLVATSRAGRGLDVVGMLQGRGEGIDLEEMPAIFREYVALVRLAQSIHQEGLLNPISVIEQRGRYLIETGERRWLAYWLLHLNLGGYERMAAIRSDGRDYVWRQAQENTARRSLNAIGMARQLALLIMDARDHLDGVHYDDYEMMVQGGECDRRFYAQVANGNIHRIPKGMGERIQAAMGLSAKRLGDYRSLLRMTDDDQINDELWIRADVEDWAEGAIREITNLDAGLIRDILNSGDWSLDDLKSEANEIHTSPIGEVSEGDEGSLKAGDAVWTPFGFQGRVVDVAGESVVVEVKGRQHRYDLGDLTPIDQPKPPTPSFAAEAVFEKGEAVMVKATEEVGEVVAVSSQALDVMIDGDRMVYVHDDVLSLGMTYEEFIQDELTHDPGVEFVGQDDHGPSTIVGMPERRDVPGVTRVSEYYDEGPAPSAPTRGREKVNSQAFVDGVDAIVQDCSHEEWQTLEAFRQIANAWGDREVVKLIDQILTMSTDEAQALHERGELRSTLDGWYARLGLAMNTWLEQRFAGVLERIENEARGEL